MNIPVRKPGSGGDKPGWLQSLAIYLEPASLRMLLLGFSAGLPLLLVIGTLGFWLREAGIDRSTIGFLSWVGLVYAFKWVWSPLVDRMPIPVLGRVLGPRRSWLLVAQLMVVGGLVCMAFSDPAVALKPLVWCAIAVAVSSATQDIALDAFRIESGEPRQLEVLAATYQTGYRLAMIWAGAGVLWIAEFASPSQASTAYQYTGWKIAYLAMAASMLPGMLTVLLSSEPARQTRAAADAQDSQRVQARCALYGVPAWLIPATAWLIRAFCLPFAEFVRRLGWQALLILALIATYRISDVVMGVMANPFYVDMGYTKTEVAWVSKFFGVGMTLLGLLVGGGVAIRIGLMRVLMLGAVLSAGSNVLFAWLAGQSHDVNKLVFVISADNFSSGIASGAFVAWLSLLTSTRHTATQYALFTSMMLLLPKFVAGYSGVYVDHFGYASFFNTTALLGVPVLLLVWLASRMQTRPG